MVMRVRRPGVVGVRCVVRSCFLPLPLPIGAGVSAGRMEVRVIVGCLALNASFEPLTMVPLRRALRLVIDGKAEIVEADRDRMVRSEHLSLPRPVVIRLKIGRASCREGG